MEAILTSLARFSGILPEFLIHAPFHHAGNITPFASLKPAFPYDLGLLEGKDAVLFGSRDKAETLGLIASAQVPKPKSLAIFWGNDAGGKGLKDHLAKLGVVAWHDAKHHARLAFIPEPAQAKADILAQWRDDAAPKIVGGTSLKAEAGLFSYRKIDPASALLLDYLPSELKGKVADFGCGWGYLTQNLLNRHSGITELTAIDDDVRAITRMQENITDPRLKMLHADIIADALPISLDAVIMNPPFHIHGAENRTIGLSFIERAAASFKKGAMLYMVANRHLPYEMTLNKLFTKVEMLVDKNGFKVIAAKK